MISLSKRNLYLTVLFLLLQTSLYSQTKIASTNYTRPILYAPQGFVLESLNGYGYSNTVISNGLNIGNSNPALLALMNCINISGSNHFETKIKDSWLSDLSHVRDNNFIPQSIGIHYPYGNLHLGLAFNQTYVSKLDYGKIIGTAVWDDRQGYIDTITFKIFFVTKIYNYSTSLAYQVYQSEDKNHSLNIGLQLNVYNMKFKQTTKDAVADTLVNDFPYNYSKSFWDVGFDIGLIYKYQNIILGATFKKGVNYNKKVRLDSTNIYIEGSTPDRLSFGIKYQISNTLDINGNISHVLWNIDRSVENQLEFNSSLVYKFLSNLTTSLGLIYTDYRFDQDDDYTKDKLGAIYLSTGLVYSYRNMNIHIVIADSHLFSQEWRKQTIFKTGIVVNL